MKNEKPEMNLFLFFIVRFSSYCLIVIHSNQHGNLS